MDFSRPMKFSGEQLRLLEHTHDSFCRSASTRLSAELRTEMQLSLDFVDQLPYSTIMVEHAPPEALVLVLRVLPHDTEAALIVEIPTALKIINRVLGGRRAATEKESGTSLTELEMAVAQRSVFGLVESLSATWEDLCGTSFRAVESETSPVSVQLVPPSEPSLVISFDTELEGHASKMTLVVPYRSISPVVDQLSYHRHDDTAQLASQAMRGALGGVEVDVRAEAGAREMAVADVLALQPGDVIRFPQRAADGVSVFVGRQIAYQAEQGAHNEKLAVQIAGGLLGAKNSF